MAEAPTTYVYEPESYSFSPLTYQYEPESYEITETLTIYEPSSYDIFPSTNIPVGDSFSGTGDDSGSYMDTKWTPRWSSFSTGSGVTSKTLSISGGKLSLSVVGGFFQFETPFLAPFDTDVVWTLTYENLVLPTDGWDFSTGFVAQAQSAWYGGLRNNGGTQEWFVREGDSVTGSGTDSSTSGTIQVTRTLNGANYDYEIYVNSTLRGTDQQPDDADSDVTNFVFSFGANGTGTASIDITDISVTDGTNPIIIDAG